MAHDKTYRKAIEKIKEAQRWGATELDFTRMKLTTLPESIGSLRHLKSLHLAGNNLTELPESIGHLAQLQVLDLFNNQLSDLPDSLTL